MIARPATEDVAPYYFTYIDQVKGDDCLAAMTAQLDDALAFFRGISEERSLHRYAPDKWSIREALSHVNDAGFWLINQYFGMSVKDTFKTWSAMETLISCVGMAGVMILSVIV